MPRGIQTALLQSVSPKHQQYLLKRVTSVIKCDIVNSEEGKESDSSVLKAKQNLTFCTIVGIHFSALMPSSFFSYSPGSLEYQTSAAFEPCFPLCYQSVPTGSNTEEIRTLKSCDNPNRKHITQL